MLERSKVVEFMLANPTASAAVLASAFGASRSAAGKMLQKLRAEGKIPKGKTGGHRPPAPADETYVLRYSNRACAKPVNLTTADKAAVSPSELVAALCEAYEEVVRLNAELNEAKDAVARFRKELEG